MANIASLAMARMINYRMYQPINWALQKMQLLSMILIQKMEMMHHNIENLVPGVLALKLVQYHVRQIGATLHA